MGSTPSRTLLAALTAALVLGGCVEKVERVEGPGATAIDSDDPAAADLRPDVRGGDLVDGLKVTERWPGLETSFGTLPEAPVAADPALEPLRIGIINQEGTPLGSFPEVRLGAQAAVDFINGELGGVDGHPVELVPCITTFSPEASQGCAQDLVEADVVAVLGGIDVTSTGSIPVLEENGLPYVGGIPINVDEMASPISFQFSGGSGGAMVAFAHHAAAEGAGKVVIAYGDYGPIAEAAAFGTRVARANGVEVVELPFPITTTDFLPVLSQAADQEADAVLVSAADTACAPVMRTAEDLGIDAQLYLVGACAAPTILEDVGTAADGTIFNIEGPISSDDPDGQLYLAAVGVWGDPELTAAGAGTVTFRSTMNLYAVLSELGFDGATPDAITEAFRAAEDRPSFNGHDYTCDGEQIPALPALCSPQQILVRQGPGGLEQLGDWVDVPAVVAEAEGGG